MSKATPYSCSHLYLQLLQLIQIPLQAHLFKHNPGLFQVVPCLDAIQLLVLALWFQEALANLQP